ncbi:MAG: four-carbon acid sugar kinase family protein [Acidobacteriota bacterium]
MVLIADDLTGALDSAVHFVTLNHSFEHLLRTTSSEGRAWSISTETRNATPEVAAHAVKRTLRNHEESLHDTLVFLKLDSAGRGPIAATILTAAEALKPQAILFAPASPHHGRTVVNTHLVVRDIANQQTTIPLRSLFPAEVHHRLAPLPIAPAEELREHMLLALADNRNIFLPDASAAKDLANIVSAAQSLSHRILWAGSSGLASALARTLNEPTQQPVPPATHPLLFCGTRHAVTQLQLRHLRDQRSTSIVELNLSTTDPAPIRSAVAAKQPTSLLLTGGDTAAFVLSALAADSITIHGELTHGIPWGRIRGGQAQDVIVATKSGGFGDHDALLHAINALTGTQA